MATAGPDVTSPSMPAAPGLPRVCSGPWRPSGSEGAPGRSRRPARPDGASSVAPRDRRRPPDARRRSPRRPAEGTAVGPSRRQGAPWTRRPAPTVKPRPTPPAAAIRSISHDIRNLLTAVRGHAELALRGLGADHPVREDVAHVVVVTASVFEMVDLLDGAPAADSQLATDIDVTVRGMRRLLDALLPRHIMLEIDTDSDRSRVPMSRLRIERIVLNLVMNARDAMAEGGRLVVATRRLDDDRVELSVADSGPGFSDDALAHLFSEGFTTKGERGGSGRGLAAIPASSGTRGSSGRS